MEALYLVTMIYSSRNEYKFIPQINDNHFVTISSSTASLTTIILYPISYITTRDFHSFLLCLMFLQQTSHLCYCYHVFEVVFVNLNYSLVCCCICYSKLGQHIFLMFFFEWVFGFYGIRTGLWCMCNFGSYDIIT